MMDGMSTHAMAAAAAEFLGELDDQTRAAASAPLTDQRTRETWNYTPVDRAGVTLGDLDRRGRVAVHRLLATALRPHAHAQAAAIMALEDVLDRSEGGRRGRHSTDYWTIVFGDPGDEAWGWRVEGHHVSVNVTVAGDQAIAVPCFLGANPATTTYAGTPVLRPLPLEEELARALLDAMGPAGRREAVVSDTAPADLRTRSAPRLGEPIAPFGVRGADLPAEALELLRSLVATFVDRLEPGLAGGPTPAEALHFAWEGPPERGAGHYYRIQGEDLFLEYDNTQDGANHVHSVLRRRTGDFGKDLLAEHYARAHARGQAGA
jgi:hypothetical protein